MERLRETLRAVEEKFTSADRTPTSSSQVPCETSAGPLPKRTLAERHAEVLGLFNNALGLDDFFCRLEVGEGKTGQGEPLLTWVIWVGYVTHTTGDALCNQSWPRHTVIKTKSPGALPTQCSRSC
jgi:hypothetical protein